MPTQSTRAGLLVLASACAWQAGPASVAPHVRMAADQRADSVAAQRMDALLRRGDPTARRPTLFMPIPAQIDGPEV